MLVDEFIVIGAPVEGAVLSTTLGLLQRGKKVRVVADAIGVMNSENARMAWRKISAKGVKLIKTVALAGQSHLNPAASCKCRHCRPAASTAVLGARS
jgi:nicotinamidase-related amidase